MNLVTDEDMNMKINKLYQNKKLLEAIYALIIDCSLKWKTKKFVFMINIVSLLHNTEQWNQIEYFFYFLSFLLGWDGTFEMKKPWFLLDELIESTTTFL